MNDKTINFEKKRYELLRQKRWEDACKARTEARKPIIEDLRNINVEIEEISDLIYLYAPISDDIVNILLKWLMRIDNFNILDMVVRVLGCSKNPFEGAALKELYITLDDFRGDSVRFAIANTISYGKVSGLDDWVIEAIKNPKYDKGSRAMLCRAVAKKHPKEKAVEVLKEVFDDLPPHAASELGRISNDISIIHFLEKKKEIYESLSLDKKNSTIRKNHIKLTLREINKSIIKIQKKINKNGTN